MDKFLSPTGKWLTQSLFWEYQFIGDNARYTQFTLKDRDHEGYPSLYRLYMETGDLTEYTFATSHLGGWSHWEALTGAGWFKPYVSRWRREIELRARSVALKAIQDFAASDHKDTLQANKFLVTGGWKPTAEKRRAGAPSKDEIRQEAQRLAQTEQAILDDLSRVKGLQ